VTTAVVHEEPDEQETPTCTVLNRRRGERSLRRP